jgi:pilus assembly protein Flp/PilA
VAAVSHFSSGTGASAMKNDFGAHFFKDQSGTTAIEYGLIAALISVVCIAGMVLVGNGLTGVYNSVSAAITPAL